MTYIIIFLCMATIIAIYVKIVVSKKRKKEELAKQQRLKENMRKLEEKLEHMTSLRCEWLYPSKDVPMVIIFDIPQYSCYVGGTLYDIKSVEKKSNEIIIQVIEHTYDFIKRKKEASHDKKAITITIMATEDDDKIHISCVTPDYQLFVFYPCYDLNYKNRKMQ